MADFYERAGQMFDQPTDPPPPSWMAGATAVPPTDETDPDQLAVAGPITTDPMRKALEDAQAQGLGILDRKKAALAPIDKDIRDLHGETGGMQPPDLQKTPAAPQQQMGQGMMEYMQIATVIGALGGLLARRGATTSLNAFSGAIQGFSQGNMEVFKAKSEEWRQAAQQVRDTNQEKIDKYEMIWKNKKMSLDQKMAERQIVASEYGDEISYNLAQQRNYTMLAQADQKERDSQRRYSATVDKLSGAAQKLTDQHDRAQEIVDGIKAGDLPPTTTGLYGLGPVVKALAAKQGVNLSKAQLEWQAAGKQIQSLNGPQMTRYVGLSQSVDRTIDEVRALADEMQNSGVPLMNRAKLELYKNAEGNSEKGQLAARYIAATNTLKEEFANLANGGYAPTEPAWALANQQIDANFGDKQLGASLTEVQKLLRYRLQQIPNMQQMGPGAANRYTPGKVAPPQDSGGGTVPTTGGWKVIQ